MTEALATIDAMAAAADRFVRVPREFARYAVDTESAARVLGLPPELVADLAPRVLPHAVDPARGPMFDHADVINLAMFGKATRLTIPDLALRFLLRFAAGRPATWYEPRPWLVRVRPPMTGAAPAGPTSITIARVDLTAPGVALLDADAAARLRAAAPDALPIEAPGYELAVRLTGAAGTVHDRTAVREYQDILAAIGSGDVTYQAVSERLRMRHTQAWDLGMADCVVLSRLLAERLRHRGLPARARRGYLLGLVGSDHAWCEIYQDGGWKPMDAVFAFLASGGSQTRRVDASPEFAAACLGSRFNRLVPCDVDEAAAPFTVDGQPGPPELPVGISAHTLGPR